MTRTEIEKGELILCQDKEDLADKAARTFAKIVNSCLENSDTCTVALSGGSTPKVLYERLLKPDLVETIDWAKIHFFVSDERCVLHESNESNFGNAQRELFEPLKLKKENLHPTEGQDKDASEAAAQYENLIRKELRAGPNNIPRFDIIFLGMGPDGHTASLFPGSRALTEKERLVAENYVEKFKAERITFTYPLINNAANVIFLVAGEDKAEVLAEVMQQAGKYPCERVKPSNGRLCWVIERGAASRLQT